MVKTCEWESERILASLVLSKKEAINRGLVPGAGFEPATSGHGRLATFVLQIMSLAP